MKKNSFTLVELLVVIAVIVILLALLLPALGSAKKKGQQIQCVGQLRQIGMAFEMYSTDWNCYPAAMAPSPPFQYTMYWAVALGPYTNDSHLSKWGYSGSHGGTLTPQSPKTMLVCPSVYPYSSSLGMMGTFLDGWWGYGMNRSIPPGDQQAWSSAYYVFPKPSAITKPSRWVLIADSRGPTLNGAWELTQPPPTCYTCDTVRHFRGANFLFCDLHVEWLSQLVVWQRATTAAALDEFYF